LEKLSYKLFYERNLPHYQPPGATLFITSRLVDSLPAHVIQQLREEAERREAALAKIENPEERAAAKYDEQRRYFGRFDHQLDISLSGPFWLSNPEIAGIVKESLHYRNGKVFTLDAYSIMSNHFHLVFKPLPKSEGKYHSISEIMHSLKLRVALEANKILGREGQFWQHESYDHVVRDEAEWRRIIQYVVNNPVKAGLVKEWQDWPWTYCRYEM
jgi:putative transposase